MRRSGHRFCGNKHRIDDGTVWTCQQWDWFLIWQRDYLSYHDYLDDNEFLDVECYREHEGCVCRTAERLDAQLSF